MAIIVKCKRGSGDREASEISDPLIVTNYMAALRGKRFLDDPDEGAYYRTVRRTLSVPHTPAGDVLPGKWISVTDGHLGMSNKLLKVTGYTINISPTSIFAQVDAEDYSEFNPLSMEAATTTV